MGRVGACRECGTVAELGRGIVERCPECGGVVVFSGTAADRLRELRREAEDAGLVERPHLADLSEGAWEAGRRALEELGIAPRRR